MPQQAGSLAGVTVEVAAKDPEKAKVFRTRTTFEIPEPVGETNPLIDLVMKPRAGEGPVGTGSGGARRGHPRDLVCLDRYRDEPTAAADPES